MIVVVLLGYVLVRDGAVHPHVGDGIAVAGGAGTAVAGLRLAYVVLASVAVRAAWCVLRESLDAGPVLVGPCAAGVARLSVLGAWRGGGVLRRARLADAGVSLACELVAFLVGAFLARPVRRGEPGKVGGAEPLVAGLGLGGVVAMAVRLGAFF